MNTLIIARHAHAASNLADVVNAVPPGEGLSEVGIAEAQELGRRLAAQPIDLGVSSRLRRAAETMAIALAGRSLPIVTEPRLDEIDFGAFEGGPLGAYRAWAWEHGADAGCPGGGESRVAAALRFAAGLEALLRRPEATVLVISHALPIRYVVDAADGSFPAGRIAHVPHATPFLFERASVERAASTLRAWAVEPRFADASLVPRSVDEPGPA